MGALQEMKITQGSQGGVVNVANLAAYFWNWYHDHSADTLVKKKILFISVTVKVRDLRGLFVQLFGEDPQERNGVIR
jgi:hypothetical protein